MFGIKNIFKGLDDSTKVYAKRWSFRSVDLTETVVT